MRGLLIALCLVTAMQWCIEDLNSLEAEALHCTSTLEIYVCSSKAVDNNFLAWADVFYK